ncbi:MAG: hypothetical protein ACOWW1_05580 [archaeon]
MNKTKTIGFALILVSLLVFSGGLGLVLSLVAPSDFASSSVGLGDWYDGSGALRYRNRAIQKVLLPGDNEVVSSVGVACASFDYAHNDLTYYVGLSYSAVDAPFWSDVLPLHLYSSYSDLMENAYTTVETGNVTVSQDFVYAMVWCDAPDNDGLDDAAYLFYADGDLSGYTDENALVSENGGELVECEPFAFLLELSDDYVAPPNTETGSPLVTENVSEGSDGADLLRYGVGGVCAVAGVFLVWLGNESGSALKKSRKGRR